MIVNCISFKGNIIDCHGHTGYWSKDKTNCTTASILNVVKDSFETTIGGKTEKNEIEYVLVSNLECMDRNEHGYFKKDEIDGNRELIERCKNNPKLKAAVVCEPSKGNAQNIEKLLKNYENDIFAFKFHPIDSQIPADSPLYEPYMKLAQKYKKPCVFHSDSLNSFASPQKIYDLAKKTPDVPVVLYHMSMAPSGMIGERPIAEQEAKGVKGLDDCVWNHREKWNRDGIKVVKEAMEKKDANLFLEISWTKPQTVVEAIKTVGADRVLFGTDIPLDPQKTGNRKWYINNIKEIQEAIRNDKEIQNADEVIKKVFYENSKKIFFSSLTSKPKGNETQNLTQKTSKLPPAAKKIIAIIAGALALTGIIFTFLKNKKNLPLNSSISSTTRQLGSIPSRWVQRP